MALVHDQEADLARPAEHPHVRPEQLVAQHEDLALVRLERHEGAEAPQPPGLVAVAHDDALGLGGLAQPLGVAIETVR